MTKSVRGQAPPVSLPAGLATSIGSVPHYDPSEAVDFALRYTPRLPAAPTLPGRSPREGMVAQAAIGVRGVTVDDDGGLDIDHDRLDLVDPLESTGFDSDAYAGLRAFLNAVVDRTDPVKLQLTGPLTLGVALHAAGVDAERAFLVAGAAVRARAQALLDLLDERIPQCARVVFLDEPALVAARLPGFPLPAEAAVDLVSTGLAALEGRAVSGLHCCGQADWNLVLQTGPQIISLPAEFAVVESAAGAFAGFLDRGGWVAWGAVPTHEPVGTTPERLWRHLSAVWCALVQEGCDPVLLRTQAMITPVCGLAGHGVTQAEQVMEFTAELAERLGDQAIGVRLQVGA